MNSEFAICPNNLLEAQLLAIELATEGRVKTKRTRVGYEVINDYGEVSHFKSNEIDQAIEAAENLAFHIGRVPF
jgi:hypothetical protein